MKDRKDAGLAQHLDGPSGGEAADEGTVVAAECGLEPADLAAVLEVGDEGGTVRGIGPDRKLRDCPADGFGACVAQHTREAFVDLEDRAVAEPRDVHQVRARVEGGRELRFGLAQFALGTDAPADVVSDDGELGDVARCVADRSEHERDVEQGAVAAHALRLEPEAAVAAQHALDELLGLTLAAGRYEDRPVATDRLGRRVAVEHLGGGRPTGDRPIEVSREGGVVRRRGDDREPGHLPPGFECLGGIAAGSEHGLQLAVAIAVNGGVVLHVGERAGDVAQHERTIADQALLQDSLMGRACFLGFCEADREVGADEAVPGNAGGLYRSVVRL